MNQFARQMQRMRADIADLKAGRIRSASVLGTGSTNLTATIEVVDYIPRSMAKITIRPTSTTAPNMLTSVMLRSWNGRRWRLLRRMDGDVITYYASPQEYEGNETIVYEIEVAYTSPAEVTLEMVPPEVKY